MKDREYYAEIEYIDGRIVIVKSDSRNIKDIDTHDIFSIKYYVKTKGNDYISRISDTYYNGERINEDYISLRNNIINIKPFSLTFDEKKYSDNHENIFNIKFKYLRLFIGQFVRVHYVLNGKEESIVGKLLYVDYYNQVVLSNGDIPFSIPFLNSNVYITRINTDRENIYINEYINNDLEYKDKLVLSYGKNYYNKRNKRLK